MSADVPTITCTDGFFSPEKKRECFQQQDNILSTRLAVFWFKSCYHVSIFFFRLICLFVEKRSCRCNPRKRIYQRIWFLRTVPREKGGIMDSILVASSSEFEVLCFVVGLVLGVITSAATVISAVRESKGKERR